MFANLLRNGKSDNINVSPWIKELNKNRSIKTLESDMQTDVAIVGGGIAGITTAYFTLKYTDNYVVLIEAGKIGHGATGHNAGQVVDYFEKPFSEIVSEYGLELAADGQKAVTSAWDLVDEILEDTKMKINFSKFTGFAGCQDLEQLLTHLENKRLKKSAGIKIHKVKISEDFGDLKKIPDKYSDLYTLVPHKKVLELLETDNQEYIAVMQSQKGCMNSALFVEKVCEYLLKQYKDRFKLFENSPVLTLDLYNAIGVLQTKTNFIAAHKVVLCTNGFEYIHITNRAGENIDKKYHKMVYGIVGYMAGYIEEKTKDPIAISYLPDIDVPQDDSRPYFYLTRRNHKYKGDNKSLVCVGGPEKIEDKDSFKYKKNKKYPTLAKNEILKFLKGSFKNTPSNLSDFDFKWHGLMGYTESGIRNVGFEPLNTTLLYNLGCNGVGILPSVYGARKISMHLAGETIKESIFDPEVQRRVIG